MTMLPISAYAVANRFAGLKEKPGAEHEPQVVAFIQRAGGFWIDDDETPWCAAFVYFVCDLLLLPRPTVDRQHTALRARKWLTVGRPIELADAEAGFDLCIFNRGGSPDPLVIEDKGHVAFYHRHDAEFVWVLGGNQGNEVKVSPYRVRDLLGVRRLYGGVLA